MQDKMEGLHASGRGGGVNVVLAKDLLKTLDNKVHLVVDRVTILVPFESENPFIMKDLVTSRHRTMRNEFVYTHVQEAEENSALTRGEAGDAAKTSSRRPTLSSFAKGRLKREAAGWTMKGSVRVGFGS